jgi:hypothetical protein
VAIWDLVPFFNEIEILALRLETLDPVVDKFVICEATQTHSGKPKPLLLQENGHRFAKWAHKIKHVVVELGQTSDWGREKEQRVCLWHGFSGHPMTSSSSATWMRFRTQRRLLKAKCQ